MGERKICRREKFDVTVEVSDEGFISPPDPSQKNWIITRAIEELADDLDHIDDVSKRFVAGSKRAKIHEEWIKSQAKYGDSQLIIDGQQVMQEWERPYMEAMAKVAAETHGDVLEVGFGMGISSSYLQAFGVRSHTIIECNEGVKKEFEKWRAKYDDRKITMVVGKWKDVIGQLGAYDSIFFDTYPLTEDEFNDYVIEDVTFAAHFFESAYEHLRKGGVFTYYSNEIDSLSRRHQRRLFDYFETVSLSVVHPLFPPRDCNYWWADSMVLIRAVK
jgi:guanidinoacetate N-methyltransferase